MNEPKHTPYDGSAGSFQIGLKPIGFENWIEIDDKLGPYLEKKHRLYNEDPDRVFVAEAKTEEAQQEVLDLLLEHLLDNYGDIYSKSVSTISVGDTGCQVDLNDQSIPPLLKGGFLVQEDLALMRRDEKGWRLVAGSVSFPSSWSLAEKFSKPLQEIHAPVPGFQTGTRNAKIIERIFDNLDVSQPVERFNWSIYRDTTLFHEGRTKEHLYWETPDQFRNAYFRIERQTLRKLPRSEDVLFTIRIHIDPVSDVLEGSRWQQIGPELVQSINSLSKRQSDYKFASPKHTEISTIVEGFVK